jgi:diguanylate cyclase
LGIKTVAESVETAAVLGKLETIGVDHVQGYAVHRPQPVEHLKL